MTAPPPRHERLRFVEHKLDRLPNGRCRARVELSWKDEEPYVGNSEGLTSPAVELRCAALACLGALTKAVDGAVRFELSGVKAVRAFDTTVVIVALQMETDGSSQRITGSCLTDEDLSRGAVLAVLNATNRMLGNRFFVS